MDARPEEWKRLEAIQSPKNCEIRPAYSFDESCQRTVPEALIAFLDSTSYEDAVRNAISLGGDSDTLACITGGIAEAFYGPVAPEIRQKVQEILPPDPWKITADFCERYDLAFRDEERHSQEP